MSIIHFKSKLFKIGSWTIIKLPKSASAKLPSRGMTIVKGTINGFSFQAALEPEVPNDLKKALETVQHAHALWMNLTTIARWDWIRSTKQLETRRRRIENACSMLKSGKRRPCCFNRTLCTEPYLSNNGVLLEPKQIIKAKMNEAK